MRSALLGVRVAGLGFGVEYFRNAFWALGRRASGLLWLDFGAAWL